MRKTLFAIVLLLGIAPSAIAATDDEVRVIDAVVDSYVETARDFWDDVHRRPRTQTMRGDADQLHPNRLAVTLRAIRPLLRRDRNVEDRETRFDTIRNERAPLYRAYARLRSGSTFSWLRDRGDLLIVPSEWAKTDRNPAEFYERYPSAQALLTLSAPAIVRDEALVYGRLLMVYSEEGRVFHLQKIGGQWEITWSAVLHSAPGC